MTTEEKKLQAKLKHIIVLEELIKKMDTLRDAMQDLSDYWIENDDNDEISDHLQPLYPFKGSIEEEVAEINNWIMGSIESIDFDIRDLKNPWSSTDFIGVEFISLTQTQKDNSCGPWATSGTSRYRLTVMAQSELLARDFWKAKTKTHPQAPIVCTIDSIIEGSKPSNEGDLTRFEINYSETIYYN